jgi:hypothetical protein
VSVAHAQPPLERDSSDQLGERRPRLPSTVLFVSANGWSKER